ncbi:hypothetical protein CJ030_MR5G017156 [Morella rubra]|uniref:Di19 C-terminal domain-containing protein n=1 Tax=Morella rubra TaxID=262757 RepID=A0A6A1VME6_9ROSI|nr:hypothetical protein CJ030_MR5G017156 [Morella rubra]
MRMMQICALEEFMKKLMGKTTRGPSFCARFALKIMTSLGFVATSTRSIPWKPIMGLEHRQVDSWNISFGISLIQEPIHLSAHWFSQTIFTLVSILSAWFFCYMFLQYYKELCCSLTSDHVQRKRRYRHGGSNSTFALLRKELRERSLPSLFGGSSCIVSSSTEPDPLLSSFMYNASIVDESVSVQTRSLVEATLVKESSKDDFLERNAEQSPLSDKDQEEKTRKCEFVQGLLLSTVLDDNL